MEALNFLAAAPSRPAHPSPTGSSPGPAGRKNYSATGRLAAPDSGGQFLRPGSSANLQPQHSILQTILQTGGMISKPNSCGQEATH